MTWQPTLHSHLVSGHHGQVPGLGQEPLLAGSEGGVEDQQDEEHHQHPRDDPGEWRHPSGWITLTLTVYCCSNLSLQAVNSHNLIWPLTPTLTCPVCSLMCDISHFCKGNIWISWWKHQTRGVIECGQWPATFSTNTTTWLIIKLGCPHYTGRQAATWLVPTRQIKWEQGLYPSMICSFNLSKGKDDRKQNNYNKNSSI